jgi:transposase
MNSSSHIYPSRTKEYQHQYYLANKERFAALREQRLADPSRKGKPYNNAKLTEAMVIKARELRRRWGMTFKKIREIMSTKYNVNVSMSALYYAITGGTWTSVKERPGRKTLRGLRTTK